MKSGERCVRIQIKIYERDGRRLKDASRELRLPEEFPSEDAVEFVDIFVRELRARVRREGAGFDVKEIRH